MTRRSHSEEVDTLKPAAIVTHGVPVRAGRHRGGPASGIRTRRPPPFTAGPPMGMASSSPRASETRSSCTASSSREAGGGPDHLLRRAVLRTLPPESDRRRLLLSMSEGGANGTRFISSTKKPGVPAANRRPLAQYARSRSRGTGEKSPSPATPATVATPISTRLIRGRPGGLKLVLKSNGEFWEAHDWSADGSRASDQPFRLDQRVISRHSRRGDRQKAAPSDSGKGARFLRLVAVQPRREGRLLGDGRPRANSGNSPASTWRPRSTRGSPKTFRGTSMESRSTAKRGASPSRSTKTAPAFSICSRGTESSRVDPPPA